MTTLPSSQHPTGGVFSELLASCGAHPLTASGVEILQMNITRRCNLACRHCHVQAGPARTEQMPREVLEACLRAAQNPGVTTIDITGGAPEMHPDLAWLLGRLAALGKRLIVRSNLVILLEEEHRHMLDVYAETGAELVGSLPDYRRERTDRQRGGGVFDRVMQAIGLLNRRGFGVPGGRPLHLVHNPSGAYLPGSQDALEAEYRRVLAQEHGVTFTGLFCLANCPVGRYLDYLKDSGNLTDYMDALRGAFNPCAVERVMCRSTVSVGPDGTLYDCDFNQILELPVVDGAPRNVADFDAKKLSRREVVVRAHCLACTAGAGSSCQGALVE